MFSIELTLDPAEEGHYRLTNAECTTIEGSASEWSQIADAIRGGRDVAFRRCAVRLSGRFYFLWSPRNSCHPTDNEVLDEDEAGALAFAIDATLRRNGEKCMFAGYDPISLGV